jgi:hypothetical protein
MCSVQCCKRNSVTAIDGYQYQYGNMKKKKRTYFGNTCTLRYLNKPSVRTGPTLMIIYKAMYSCPFVRHEGIWEIRGAGPLNLSSAIGVIGQLHDPGSLLPRKVLYNH